MLPAFSFVIPAFNEADRIAKTLRETLSYLKATSPQSELIVVDDGSTDATSEIVRDIFAAGTEVTARLLEHSPIAEKAPL